MHCLHVKKSFVFYSFTFIYILLLLLLFFVRNDFLSCWFVNREWSEASWPNFRAREKYNMLHDLST